MMSKGKRGFTRILYVTDPHGSEKCFLKFLRAGTLYNADVMILSGDLTGKMVVPLVEQPDHSHKANFMGYDLELRTEEEVLDLEKKIRDSGFYRYRTDTREMEELNADPSKIDKLFKQLMIETLAKWITLAEERLRDTGIMLYMNAANDDPLAIEPVLDGSGFVKNPEGKVVPLDANHEMISTGFSNMTPWKCPRDIPEDELEKRIEAMASQVKDMKNCVFNFHCPPIDSGLDKAPKLDASSMPPKPVTDSHGVVMFGAGSVSVRKAIEQHQPLLGLHGHIHESRGFTKIGRTLCINPGSEYGEGILRGVLVNIEKEKVKGFQFISG